jgi:hypothetical protein
VSARPLTKRDIERLFRKLNAELAKLGIRGEVHLVGGAVLCLVHEAREATQDVDVYFRPVRHLRATAARVALEEGVPENWLNDAVKGFSANAARSASTRSWVISRSTSRTRPTCSR